VVQAEAGSCRDPRCPQQEKPTNLKY
jgi:hypothetical protein